MSANEVKQQLHMLHNPFSSATPQPKIPDGKVSKSLGLATQAVEEITVPTGGPVPEPGLCEILLFPGINAMCLVKNTAKAGLNRGYYIPKFQNSNNVNWDGNVIGTDTGFNVAQTDNYAMWRTVSAGMQLKLLNSVEEDDGWWEACRLTVEKDNTEWRLTTTDNQTDRLNFGTLAPVNQLNTGINLVNIANEPSYSTGLLRDLHRVQFELHTQKDFHEFIHMRDDIRLATSAQNGVSDPDTIEISFNPGYDDPIELIDNFTDQNLDCVYIKLHCRNGEGVSPSRFHMNLVMNQEICFDPSARESRFQTRAHNIGAGPTSIHLSARRNDGNAAHMVVDG